VSGRVVLIEGLDLAGKTTLARRLAQTLARSGVAVRSSRNALCPDNPVAMAADRLRRDPEAGWQETGSLFLSAHLWDARHFPPAAWDGSRAGFLLATHPGGASAPGYPGGG
jgi:thymidylate kinase